MSDVLNTLGNYATPQNVLGGLGLGFAALRGNQPLPGQQQMTQMGTQLGAQGAQMTEQALQGNLPAGATAMLDQRQNAADAGMRSSMARMGLSGSTMEAQGLQSSAQQRLGDSFKMAQGMIAEGIKMSGMSAQMLEQIMKANVAQDDAFIQAVGKYSASLAGAV
jgi:hypothetical protein